MCLTISPLITGGGAGRIVAGTGPAIAEDSGGATGGLTLAHVLEDSGSLLCRYLRRSSAGR